MASSTIYEFTAELDDYKPKVWRKFQIMGSATIARLCYVLMTMFEMKAEHLFRLEMPTFKAGQYDTFEIITEDTYFYRDKDEEVFDATEHVLAHSILQQGDVVKFVYDFGDNWQVLVKLEAKFKDKITSGREFPRVLAGEGFGIIENSGGVYGLKNIAKSFAGKINNKDIREWLGIDMLNLNSFDIEDMNFRLKRIPRIFSEIYEYELEPTKRSLALLNRHYKSPNSG